MTRHIRTFMPLAALAVAITVSTSAHAAPIEIQCKAGGGRQGVAYGAFTLDETTHSVTVGLTDTPSDGSVIQVRRFDEQWIDVYVDESAATGFRNGDYSIWNINRLSGQAYASGGGPDGSYSFTGTCTQVTQKF